MITILGLSGGLLWGGSHGWLTHHVFLKDVFWLAMLYGLLVRLSLEAFPCWRRQLAGVVLGWLLSLGCWHFTAGLDGISHTFVLILAGLGFQVWPNLSQGGEDQSGR